LARGVLVAGEEREVDLLELVAANALDERDLFADGFQLAEGFVVVEKLDVGGWKLALAEHVGDFLALERTASDQGDSVKAGRGFLGAVPVGFLRTHEGCEAS